MVWDSTGLYVGLGGWCDIHCKFLSTFRGCLLTSKSMCIIYMLHMCLSEIWQCTIIAFVSSLTDILPMSYFVFILCTTFTPGESVYWFHMVVIFPGHITFPHLCGVNFLLSTVNSIHCKFCWVWSDWALICTLCSLQWTVLCTWCSQPCPACYIRAEILGTVQIWQSYIEETMTLLSRGKMWGWWTRKSLFGRNL